MKKSESNTKSKTKKKSTKKKTGKRKIKKTSGKQQLSRKVLRGFKFEPAWFSLVGALYSVLNYRKENIPLSHLYGWTFSGFRINIEKNVFPNSVNNFPWQEVFPLICDNIGYNFHYIQSIKGQNLFYIKKEEAIELIREQIKEKQPVIAFGLDAPEFGVIFGYDDEKEILHFADAENAKGQLKYKELGETNTKYLSVLSIEEKLRIDVRKSILYSLTYALWYSEGYESIEENSFNGLKAYDLWIEELRRKKFDPYGNSYNASVILECRQNIVSYFNSIIPQFKPKLAGYLKKANRNFQKVVMNFNEFVKLFPYPGNIEDTLDEEKILSGIFALREAEKYETEAYKHIKDFLDDLKNIK